MKGGAVALVVGAGLLLAARKLSPSSRQAPPVPTRVRDALPLQPTPLSPQDWFRARLTEYHPDAPAYARRREGGPHDRMGQPLYTLQQHRSDRAQFPYASVAADLILQGRQVPYGVRVYVEALPGDVLRIVDTGGHFYNSDKTQKVIRQPGHEPLDIATAWPGGQLDTFSASKRLTRYRVDWDDVLPEPKRARKRAPNA